eukprot:scaffold10581_cov117-Isochrysis_galbana.AAC.10
MQGVPAPPRVQAQARTRRPLTAADTYRRSTHGQRGVDAASVWGWRRGMVGRLADPRRPKAHRVVASTTKSGHAGCGMCGDGRARTEGWCTVTVPSFSLRLWRLGSSVRAEVRR